MNLNHDEFGALIGIIRRELVYYRTFEGKVLTTQDSLNRGRIKVSIPQLGWMLESDSMWVEPEHNLEQKTPNVGDYAIVYFLEGNANNPIYRGCTTRLRAGRLEAYVDPQTAVLYEDENISIVYARNTHILTTTIGEIVQEIDGDNNLSTLTIGGVTQEIDGKNNLITTTIGDVSLEVNGDDKTLSLAMGDTDLSIADGELSAKFNNCSLETDGSKWTIDASGNPLELTSSKMTVGALEVLK